MGGIPGVRGLLFMDRQTYGQKDKHMDEQTKRHMNSQTDGQIDKLT